ncbi:MAG: hypothetical protein EB084_16960, partial [Proteobacteria bacterium]|nr:hypothetical protein [Pseudomonadota bacterium]
MAQSQFEQALARANALVAEGKLEEGAALYEQLIAHEPQNRDLYRDLAMVYERKGDIPSAIKTHLRWADLCVHLGLPDEALRLYNQVLSVEQAATNPEKKGLFKSSNASPDKIRELVAGSRAAISIQIGRIYLQKMMADEAIKALKGAIDASQGGHDHHIHMLLGIAYMQKSMDKEAIGEFQEVVRLAPNEAAFAYEKLGEIYRRTRPTASSVWYRSAGDLYLRNEQYQNAVGAYEMILQTEPRNKDVLSGLADIYTRLGMTEQALATWRNLAAIYTEEGLLDKVIIIYEKVTENSPDDQESSARLLEIYRGILQRDPSNLSVRQKLIKHLLYRGEQSGAIPEYMALAQSYAEKGVYDEAAQILESVLELDGSHAKALELLGDVCLHRGDRKEALSRFLEALKLLGDAGAEDQRHALSQKLTELFPEESGVQYEMARSLKDQGSFGEALAEIMKVLEQDPNHVQALLEASELLSQMGRVNEARDLCRRILEVDPSRSDVRLRLFEQALSTGDLEAAAHQAEELAASLRAAGLVREAEAVYRRLLSYEPENAEIRMRVCALRLESGDVESVLREYLLLANLHLRRRSLEKAAEMYAAILAHRPDHLPAHLSLARVRAHQGQHPEALGHFAFAIQEFLARNLVEPALGALRESVAVDPSNLSLRQRLGELLAHVEREDEASEQYRGLFHQHLERAQLESAAQAAAECMRLVPMNLDLRLELATAYLEHNRLDEGKGLLEEVVSAALASGDNTRVIDIYDKMAHVYRAQGRHDLYWQTRERTAELYRGQGRDEEAIAEFQEIVEAALRGSDFDRARACFPALADLYSSTGQLDQGVQIFERLVEGFVRESRPLETEVSQTFLLSLLERKGDQGQALQMLAQLATRAQEAGDADLAAILHGRVFDLLVATDDLERAAEVQFVRIDHALSRKDLDTARAVWKSLRDLRPQSSADLTRYTDALYQRGFLAEVLPLLIGLSEAAPGDRDVSQRLAVVSARTGDMARAADLARTVLGSEAIDRILVEVTNHEGADDAERCLRFGDFYREMGFYEEALLQYQAALQHASRRIEALNRLALLFRRAGYIDLAVRQLQRVLETPGADEEDLLETRYNLATLYYEAGRCQEALDMYNECAAVKLRYRDVAERIEELTLRVASLDTTHPDVIPITSRSSTAAPEASEGAPLAEAPVAAALVGAAVAVEEVSAVLEAPPAV